MVATRVLFACTKNAVRSPMAEGLAQQRAGEARAYTFQSAGLDPGDVDGFAVAAMAEQGIDLRRHESQDLADFQVGDFDLLICLSAAASRYAQDRFGAADFVEHWDVGDPSEAGGNRDQRLAAYREVRDAIEGHIAQRFPL